MKNITLLLIFLGGFLFNSNAQAPEYDDLVQYYADGDYDKLLKKAFKYTQGDKTKKHALPYYYLSIANFQISKGHDLLEKYPKAFKDAVKYAGKCIQKDKDSVIVVEKMGLFTDLKVAINEELRNLAESEEYNRMPSVLSQMIKIDKYSVGAHFLKISAYYVKKDKANIKKYTKICNDLFDNINAEQYSIDEENDDYDLINRKKADLELLKIGIMEYTKILVANKQSEKAEDIMGKTKQWYPEDKEYKAAYDEIVN
jgi:hypothetical protein